MKKKHYTPLQLLPSIFLLLQSVKSDCPFPGTFPIRIEAADVEDAEIWTNQYDTPKTIKPDGLQIKDEALNRVLNPHFTPTPDNSGYVITFTPSQPDFMDELDYNGNNDLISQIGDGLIIAYDDDTEQECSVRLTIEDTNNRSPIFMTNGDVKFEITTAWDTSVPLNFKPEDLLKIKDDDFTYPTITIEQGRTGSLTLTGSVTDSRESIPFTHLFDLQLFLSSEDDKFTPGTHTITINANDGVNETPLNVAIVITQENRYEPRFTSSKYVATLSEMPKQDTVIDVDIEAYDPDDELSGVKSTFVYEVEGEGEDYLVFNSDGKLTFKRMTPENTGLTKTVQIKATQQGTDAVPITSSIEIRFPTPKVFPDDTYFFEMEPLTKWPEEDDILTLPGIIDHPDEVQVFYQIRRHPTDVISLPEPDMIKFLKDVNEEDVGPNRVIIFEVVGLGVGDIVLGAATYVIKIQIEDEDGGTTTGTTEGVTECVTSGPTTEFDCSVCSTTSDPVTDCPGGTETPQPCDSCCDCGSTTSEPCDPSTTPEPCTPVPCDPTSTPEPCTPVPCDPTSTSEPPPDCPSTTEPPPDCSTGTITECPSCTTTDNPPITDPTNCPPPDCTPEPCVPTTDPPSSTPESCDCDCSSTGNPSTDCPDNPITNPPECTPEPCNCDTTGPTECPTPTTPETCDCESVPCSTDGTTTECPPSDNTCAPCPCDQDDDDDDCSNTGLVIAVIATSVLCVGAIGSTGLALWLLRKATVDPTRFARESIFSTSSDKQPLHNESRPSTPPEQPPSSTYDYPRRISFGDTEAPIENRFTTPTGNNASADGGFTNPSFIDIEETPVISKPEPVVTNHPPPPEPEVTQPVKKSNIKTPKEIEPDYEEVPVEPTKTDSQKKLERKQSRVLFAPEDEYISIDDDDAGDGADGGGAGEGPSNEFGESDVEDERL